MTALSRPTSAPSSSAKRSPAIPSTSFPVMLTGTIRSTRPFRWRTKLRPMKPLAPTMMTVAGSGAERDRAAISGRESAIIAGIDDDRIGNRNDKGAAVHDVGPLAGQELGQKVPGQNEVRIGSL